MEVLELKTVSKKLYEAMFLVDSGKAASDWDGVQELLKNVLQRAEAEVVSIKKWDERRLAYEIRGHSRGTYVLCYFRADGRRNSDIERNVQLSEQIIRVLILCADHVKPEDIDKDTPATLTEQDRPKVETIEALEKPAGQEDVRPEVEIPAETGMEERSEAQQDSANVREEAQDAAVEQAAAAEVGGSEQQEESPQPADGTEQESKEES
jgi:small subunit ribosomal protein S6